MAAFAKLLAGFDVFSPESGDKESRALPVSAQAEIGNVKVVKADWNADFLEEICTFPTGTYKDQTDALSRAFAELLKQPQKIPIVGPDIISGGPNYFRSFRTGMRVPSGRFDVGGSLAPPGGWPAQNPG